MKDAINPEHYKSECSLECYQAMILALGDEGFINFCLGNAFKYMWRHKYKGKPKEDMDKAHWYLLKALEYSDSDSDQFNRVCEFNHIWKKIYDKVDKSCEVE